MSKLTDVQIRLLSTTDMVDGLPLIEPFNEAHLTPNGYDLTVGEVEVNGKSQKLEDIKNISIPPKTFFRVMTLEKVNLNSELVAELWLRSSYARKGVMATFGFVDAGFKGKLALSLYNSSDEKLDFSYNGLKTVCQIVFEDFPRPEKIYEERSGNYQNQESLK